MAFGRMSARGGFGGLGLLGGAVPPYLGQVATSSQVPNARVGVAQVMAESRHIARDDITAVALLIPTWYVNHSNLQETAISGTTTATASFNFPLGTFSQVKFGGAASGPLAGGITFQTDFTPVSIPRGSIFGVRAFLQCSGGIPFLSPVDNGATFVTNCGRDEANGERFQFAASGLTDLTMGGTITSTTDGGRYGWRPVGIIAKTRRASITFIADSRVMGLADFYNDGSYNVGELARAIGPSFAYINDGIAGQSTTSWLASNPLQLALAQFCSHKIPQLAINDFGLSGYAAYLARQQTIFAALGNKNIFGVTVPPQTTSTDSWATSANQSVSSRESDRLTYNAALRSATIVNLAGYFDFASVA